MRWVVDNYDSAQEFAHSQIPAITAEYDWLRQTEETFNALQGRINL
jgi:hypothetical protein